MRTARYQRLFSSITITASALAMLGLGVSMAYGRGDRPAPRAKGSVSSMPPQAGYTVQSVQGGTIAGKVLYVGKAVKPRKMAVTQDRATCGSSMETYQVRVEQGGVVNAVVWIDNITHGKAFAFPKAVLDQKKCMFVPDVVLMKPGQLEVMNSDPITHNIRITARYNRGTNKMMAAGASPLEITLMRPETVVAHCDIHSWMEAYVVVAKNPYYVISKSGGSFQLTDVPPGTYQLNVWQQKLGTKKVQVTVSAGKTSTVDFKLGS